MLLVFLEVEEVCAQNPASPTPVKIYIKKALVIEAVGYVPAKQNI